MNSEDVKYSVSTKGIAELRLNRPTRLNAVIEALYELLIAYIEKANSDKNVKVIVLTGEGRAFCVGADLKAHKTAQRDNAAQKRYLELASLVTLKIIQSNKPVIAGVNGYAFGAGAEMAMACDFILMDASAEIGFPEVGLGTFIGGGLSMTLPRRVGLSKAKALVMLAERVTADVALEIGLVDKVINGDFYDDVMTFCEMLVTKAPYSMSLTKSTFRELEFAGLEQQLKKEEAAILSCMETKDWQEGINAFNEKRSPIFTGE